MKTLLSIVLVLIVASVASAQPPRGGKFGAGEGQFGDPAKMAEMRENMRQRWQTENQVPGPPPWAGRGMRMGGPRGPQNPFLGRGLQSPTDLRRGGPKREISVDNPNFRGRGRKFDNQSNETKRGGVKGKKFRGNNQVSKVIIVIKIN